MAARLKLISHKLCPYVQRAVIALTEKRVVFERIDIDLVNKPDWFLAISPLGKTPVLQVGDVPIFESAVILEYLEETQPKRLHPADPVRRAEHRAWIEFGSAVLNDIAGFYAAADEATFKAKTIQLEQRFARLETRRVRSGVPLFRCVRRYRRLRNSRRQAEASTLAQEPRGAALGAHGRERRISGAASRFP